jgi:hypothetical protein
MAFQSEFADNAKLQACANNDGDHIGEQHSPKGPWVISIKKALNAWAAKQQPPVGQIPVNDVFGQETGDLVALYKTRQTPPILNFAGKIDRIVGKKTVVALDKELPQRGGGGGGVIVSVPIVNQPPDEIFLLTLMPDQDGQSGRPLKDDLDSKTRQLRSSDKLPRVRVWGAKLGLGAALLDELEKAALSSTPIDVKSFLLKMLAGGKLEKNLFDEITFNDIKSFPDIDLARVMSVRAVTVNEGLLRNEMSVGGPVALEMFNFWITHSISPPPLKNFSSLDSATAATESFIKAAEQFETRLKENLRQQFKTGRVDYHDLVTGPGPERVTDSDGNIVPPVPDKEPGKATQRMLPAVEPVLPDLQILLDTVVKICIGSFQGVRVFLSDFKATATSIPAAGNFFGKLHYELRDHFGVDDDDCVVRTRGIHGTPGQVAMWVLQHYSASGHKPFIDQVLVQREFSGTFT